MIEPSTETAPRPMKPSVILPPQRPSTPRQRPFAPIDRRLDPGQPAAAPGSPGRRACLGL